MAEIAFISPTLRISAGPNLYFMYVDIAASRSESSAIAAANNKIANAVACGQATQHRWAETTPARAAVAVCKGLALIS